MYGEFQQHLVRQLQEVQEQGLEKSERLLQSPQQPHLEVAQSKVLNLCANNYLGLANHPRIVAAAQKGLDDWGFGMASVRFICGTQSLHRELE